MSSFLHLPPSAVLKHWACAKILRSRPTSTSADTGVDDQVICDAIVRKFEKVGGVEVSYAEIAKKAWEVGRTELATKVYLEIGISVAYVLTFSKLLDYEPRASDQVPLLLNMKQDRLALAKAVESGDTDLGKITSI